MASTFSNRMYLLVFKTETLLISHHQSFSIGRNIRRIRQQINCYDRKRKGPKATTSLQTKTEATSTAFRALSNKSLSFSLSLFGSTSGWMLVIISWCLASCPWIFFPRSEVWIYNWTSSHSVPAKYHSYHWSTNHPSSTVTYSPLHRHRLDPGRGFFLHRLPFHVLGQRSPDFLAP